VKNGEPWVRRSFKREIQAGPSRLFWLLKFFLPGGFCLLAPLNAGAFIMLSLTKL
jgi:hypothetical protein